MHNINKTVLLLFFGSLFLVSCGSYTVVPEHIKARFTFRHGDSLQRAGLIPKTNGYYRSAHSTPIPHYTKPFDRDKITYTPDTAYNYLVFYSDGTVLTYGLYHYDTVVLETFRKVMDDPDSPLSRGFYIDSGWGQYRMFHDTIKIQYIHHPTSGAMSRLWYAWEEQFVILDENTVRIIAKKSLPPPESVETPTPQTPAVLIQGSAPAYFVAFQSIPKPNCWLKKESWFMER